MPEVSYIFDKLLICDPDKSRSTCHVFAAHQSPAEEQSLGKLFLVAEINSRDRINLNIINTIQEELKKIYYTTEDLNIETAFEKSLESTNQRIADMVGDYDTNWLDKLNIITAVLQGQSLYFSSIGRVHAFLVRGGKIIDIIQSTHEGDPLHEIINPLKAFSNIVNGPLQEKDVLLLTTPNLLDYLSQEKLRRLVADHSPSQAVRMIDNLLSENTTGTAFGALIIKTTRNQNAPTAIQTDHSTHPAMSIELSPPTDTETSMADLLEKQAATGDVLSPSLSKHLWNSIKQICEKIGQFIKLKVFRQSPRRVRFQQRLRTYESPTPLPPQEQTKSTRPKLQAAANTLKKSARISGTGLKKLSAVAKQTGHLATSAKHAPGILSRLIQQLIIRFKRLPRISQLLFLAILLIGFILAQNIFSAAQSQQNKKNNMLYEQTISSISEKILEAEAALSYGNESGAHAFLTDAQELLDELPDEKNTEQKKSELQNDIDSQLEKTKHIAMMLATERAKLSEADGTAATVNQLALAGTTLYSFNPSSKTIFALSIDSGAIERSNPNTTASLQYMIAENASTVLFLDNGNGLREHTNGDDTLRSLNFHLNTDNANITSMVLYLGRLYFLDISNNQIFRAAKTNGGYTTPVEWISDGTDVTSAKSMAIDGNIYVLLENGRLLKLTEGDLINWTLSSIDPALTSADKVWTDPDTPHLYILDKQGRRIIEYTKDGQLINQYMSDSFTDLRDIAIDYQTKTIYILNGSSILSIDILPQS